MAEADRSGMVSGAQSILGLCRNDFLAPPDIGRCRVYMGSVLLTWRAYGKMKTNIHKIKYEVGYRWDGEAARPGKRDPALVRNSSEWATKGDILPRVHAVTPADYLERLIKVEPKHTSRPDWTHFDFTGPVAMLGAWLATLTWFPGVSLFDLYDPEKIKINHLNQLPDSSALSCNTVFLSQQLSGQLPSGCYWVLVSACGACGSSVATDRAILSGPERARLFGAQGPKLWKDILDALRLLGELYDRAGAGEVFGYAVAKGLHTVNTVVSHSDEGGLFRDVLRECRFALPFGGIPPDSPLSGSLPTVTISATYQTLVTIVDSLSLTTAAAVAQAGTVVTTDTGTTRPIVVYGRMTPLMARGVRPADPAIVGDADRYARDQEQYRLDCTEHVNLLRAPLHGAYTEMAEYYLPALANIFRMSRAAEETRPAHTWLSQAAPSVLENYDNRHLLKNDAVAPFFWIEPTTILPRKWCLGPAETGGWGSLGGPGEAYSERMFPNLCEVDIPTATARSYEIDFEGARKCAWLICLLGHKEDGLAQMHFKRLDPEALCLLGGRAARDGPGRAHSARYPVSDYLWVRGQSKLPHPAECLNMFDRVVMVINHYKVQEDRWLATVPSHNEIAGATYTVDVSAPDSCGFAERCAETRREHMARTRGADALMAMASLLNADDPNSLHEGGYLTVGIRRRQGAATPAPPLRSQAGGPQSTQVEAPTQSAGHTAEAAAPQPSRVLTAASAPMSPVLAAGTHAGPRVPQTGGGQPGPESVQVAPASNNPDGQTEGGGGAQGTAPTQ
ncbi:coat protein [Eimeria tenella RNA virus 1]|uniref:Coat protein n=1 Tax=Eimeria tenella RNA virus 1 TaxID=1566868 RepID=A0A0A7DR11_9VIRU|nr:coat protein [Eimeria tenella RNA virus 1]AIW58882.1 coat protein [Eimeria tenella RNA virus 1]